MRPWEQTPLSTASTSDLYARAASAALPRVARIDVTQAERAAGVVAVSTQAFPLTTCLSLPAASFVADTAAALATPGRRSLCRGGSPRHIDREPQTCYM